MKKIKRKINKFLGVKVPNKNLNKTIVTLFLVLVLVLGLAISLVATKFKIKKSVPKKEIETVASGEKVSLKDHSIGEIWLPALEGVPKNTYEDDGFVSDQRFKYYRENDKNISTCGIDVSTFQGDINWEKVKADGVDFVMVRSGGRGYTNGEIYEDDKFISNVKGAKKAGLKVGAYFFSQAINEKEAKEEAEFILNQVKDLDLDYPIAFDWEVIGSKEARTDDISPQALTDSAKAFCNVIKENNYTPMIYISSRLGYYKYDLSQLADISLWYVEYHAFVPSFYYNFDIWQYSESGTVDGIEGSVDLNIGFKEF